MKPFEVLIEEQDDAFLFLKEKSQLMPLIITILQKNLELFEMIWEECSFFWNESHLLVIVDRLISANWLDGLNIILQSFASH